LKREYKCTVLIPCTDACTTCDIGANSLPWNFATPYANRLNIRSVKWIEDAVRQKKNQKATENKAATSKARKAAYRRADSALTVDRPNAEHRRSIFSLFSSPSRTWKGGILIEEGAAWTWYAEVGRIALALAVGTSVGVAISTRSTSLRS